jgi:hypothetical protein
MKRWLRRNWIGLIAVAVLLPATVGITFATQWNAYFGERPSAPVTVVSGETADFGNAQWALDGSRRISASSAEGRDLGLPAGSDLVVVSVRVSPDIDRAETPGCLVTLDELNGSSITRSWGESATDPIEYTPTEGKESYCSTEAVGDYTLESVFVVASDAGDDLALSLTVPSELPRYLSLRL